MVYEHEKSEKHVFDPVEEVTQKSRDPTIEIPGQAGRQEILQGTFRNARSGGDSMWRYGGLRRQSWAQNGLLRVGSFAPTGGALFWMSPCISFSIVMFPNSCS